MMRMFLLIFTDASLRLILLLLALFRPKVTSFGRSFGRSYKFGRRLEERVDVVSVNDANV